jgi:hypothetical protein
MPQFDPAKEHTVGGPVVLGPSGQVQGLGDMGAGSPVYPIPSRGLTPTVFADQFIKFRIPYSMAGELTLAENQTAQQFAADTFRHSRDKPMEIWRTIVRVTALSPAPSFVFEPQPTTMRERVRIHMHDTSKNEDLMAARTLVSALQTDDALTWEWEVPSTPS